MVTINQTWLDHMMYRYSTDELIAIDQIVDGLVVAFRQQGDGASYSHPDFGRFQIFIDCSQDYPNLEMVSEHRQFPYKVMNELKTRLTDDILRFFEAKKLHGCLLDAVAPVSPQKPTRNRL